MSGLLMCDFVSIECLRNFAILPFCCFFSFSDTLFDLHIIVAAHAVRHVACNSEKSITK